MNKIYKCSSCYKTLEVNEEDQSILVKFEVAQYICMDCACKKTVCHESVEASGK